MKGFALSLRVRLMLVVLLAVVPALALILNSAAESRQEATGRLQESGLFIARTAATDHQTLVDSTRHLLEVLAQQPPVRGDDVAACRAFFADLLPHFPNFTGFGIALPNGDVTCVEPLSPTPVNLADRPYFQMALSTGGFSVGEYSIGRVSGKPILVMALPLLDANNRVRRVLTVGVDIAWLEQRVQQSQLSDWAVTLIDRHGTVLARHPAAASSVGRSLKDETPVASAILESAAAGVSEARDADGTTRLYAYVPLGGNGSPIAYVTISRPKSAAVAEANRKLARDLAGMGVASLLALFAAWVGADVFMLRQVRALVRASRRLSTGELGARSGLVHPTLGARELNELALAFDEMAESLAWHQRQRASEESRRSEIARAARLQRELLPRVTPRVPGFDLAARCLPAQEVGGDFYDWVELAPGVLTLTVGDVMGKGISAALMMATVRAALRAVTHEHATATVLSTTPAGSSGTVDFDLMRSRRFVGEFHAHLVESAAAALEQDLTRADSFVTLFHAQLDAATRRVDYVDAGHGCVFVRRASGRAEELPLRDLPIGVVARYQYHDTSVILEPGDTLVVYSDGLLDARPELADTNIHATLAAELNGAETAEEMVARLVDSPRIATPPGDDLTVLIVRCRDDWSIDQLRSAG